MYLARQIFSRSFSTIALSTSNNLRYYANAAAGLGMLYMLQLTIFI